ncbi:(2Fe-2S)-binding protein [Tabrizicola sp.]|uniref:(2Fe-2S)-binding protein n=1 Tax=Tabrizicola sp. TaxID=2005166 RepID=UPI003F2A856D
MSELSTKATSLTVNGVRKQVEADPATPLLWALRDHLGLTGTKFGCGQALCGACTVHVDGEAVRSCVISLRDVESKNVTTIEGLGAVQLHVLQQAWIRHQVPQCGYCQPGFIMAAVALLEEKPNANGSDIDEALTNICRCGTYARIRRAILDLTKGG